MWAGDPDAKLSTAERTKLLAQRAELVKEVTRLKTAPLERGDQQIKQKYRQQDIMDLATRIVALDKRLGRTK